VDRREGVAIQHDVGGLAAGGLAKQEAPVGGEEWGRSV